MVILTLQLQYISIAGIISALNEQTIAGVTRDVDDGGEVVEVRREDDPLRAGESSQRRAVDSYKSEQTCRDDFLRIVNAQ